MREENLIWIWSGTISCVLYYRFAAGQTRKREPVDWTKTKQRDDQVIRCFTTIIYFQLYHERQW